ncbi:MAG: PQQ-binding-like beta-propeller repeat protein, partial [Planctomycetales bacterium]
RSGFLNWTFHKDRLYVQTKLNGVSCIDAETGRVLWSRQVGRPGKPSGAPAANDQYVCVLNANSVHLLSAETGKTMWDAKMRKSIPMAGAAISEEWVFVPQADGMISAYNLEEPTEEGWSFGTGSRIDIPPIISGDQVIFANIRGMVFSSSISRRNPNFQFETDMFLSGPLAQQENLVFVPMDDNAVYAVSTKKGENIGTVTWRFNANGPVLEKPAVIDNLVYLARHNHGLYCVYVSEPPPPPEGEEAAEAEENVRFRTIGTGARADQFVTGGVMKWYAPGAQRFIAASKDRVYAADTYGRTLILDAQSGARLGVIATEKSSTTFINTQNDRLYYATAKGLIQCLREIKNDKKPVWHNRPEEEGDDEGEADPADGGADPDADPANVNFP